MKTMLRVRVCMARSSRMSEEEILLLAEKLKKAFEDRDIDAITNLYSDDVVVWHNYDQIERTRKQALESAKWVVDEMSEFKIEDCNIFLISGGYIQQCVFRGVYKENKGAMETYAMIRIYCSDGKVDRVEDYSDPAQGAVPDLH